MSIEFSPKMSSVTKTSVDINELLQWQCNDRAIYLGNCVWRPFIFVSTELPIKVFLTLENIIYGIMTS